MSIVFLSICLTSLLIVPVGLIVALKAVFYRSGDAIPLPNKWDADLIGQELLKEPARIIKLLDIYHEGIVVGNPAASAGYLVTTHTHFQEGERVALVFEVGTLRATYFRSYYAAVSYFKARRDGSWEKFCNKNYAMTGEPI